MNQVYITATKPKRPKKNNPQQVVLLQARLLIYNKLICVTSLTLAVGTVVPRIPNVTGADIAAGFRQSSIIGTG